MSNVITATDTSEAPAAIIVSNTNSTDPANKTPGSRGASHQGNPRLCHHNTEPNSHEKQAQHHKGCSTHCLTKSTFSNAARLDTVGAACT